MESGRLAIVAACAAVALFWAFPAASFSSTDNPQKSVPAFELLQVGPEQPDDRLVEVWTNQPMDKGFGTGDKLIVGVEPKKDLFAIAIVVTSDGTVIPVFPHPDGPDKKLEAGKEYTLFGDDGKVAVTVGDESSAGGIALYVSEKPLNLPSLASAAKMPIPFPIKGDSPKIGALVSELKTLADTKDLFRVPVPISETAGEPRGIAAKSVLKHKRLRMMKGIPPGKDTSSKPGSVTGVQGMQEKIEKPDMK